MTKKNYNEVSKISRDISGLLEKLQGLKIKAIAAAKELEAKEMLIAHISAAIATVSSSLESCKGQRTLPTIKEMCQELLVVVVAAGNYAKYEKAVKPINCQVFGKINHLVDWQAIIADEDADEDLQRYYTEAKTLTA